MKKIAILLLCLLTISMSAALTSKKVSVAVAAQESSEVHPDESAKEELPSESINSGEEVTITKDELKQLLDDALSDYEKKLIAAAADKLSIWTNLDYTTIYLIIAAVSVVLLAVVVFAIKYAKNKMRLKATQSAYTLEKEIADSNSEILKTLSNEGVFKLVMEALKEGGDEVVVKIANALKLDEATIAKIITAQDMAEEREKKIMLALKAIARDAGKTEIVNALSAVPEKTVVEAALLENEKLKLALGDEKVKEILAT